MHDTFCILAGNSLILSYSLYMCAHTSGCLTILDYTVYCFRWEGRFVSGSGTLSISQHRIEFSRPLERVLFLQRCKGKHLFMCVFMIINKSVPIMTFWFVDYFYYK